MKTKLLFTIIFLSLSIHSFALDKISIGTIDTEPEEKIGKFQAVAEYLESNLNGIKVSVEIPKNINTAIKQINNNKLDIFIDSVYPTLLVQKSTDIQIVCKRWKKGQEGYKSVIFVNANSPISKLEELKGKSISFEDEHSTSGYYIPKKDIEKNGLKISNDGDINSIKYEFARSEKNTAVWLLYGKVDAAVTDDKTFLEFDKDLFKIIHKSKLIPRHLVSFSKRIDKKLQDKIIKILYEMENTKEGQKTLKEFSKTKRFSPLTKDDLSLIEAL